MNSPELARHIVDFCLSKKAHDVTLMDVRNISGVTDFFICCHGDAEPQIRAIYEAVEAGAKKLGQSVWHKEGTDSLNWVLLDYVDVVVHIFKRETREFYGLERLWGDAKTETFNEDV